MNSFHQYLLLILGFALCLGLGCAQENGPEAGLKSAVDPRQAVQPSSPAEPTVTKVAETTGLPPQKKLPTGFDWPHWRGPHYDGISRETDWKITWPDEGPNKLWSKKLGIGFSSLAVADGKLYSMGHEEGKDTIWCFHSTTGEEVWRHSYECPLFDNLHEGGPAATPTVDGDQVYTLSKAGHFFCLNAATGEVKWSKDVSRQLGVAAPEWGFSGSPVVLDKLVMIEAGRLAAFDKRTGELVWKTQPYRPGYGSPTVFQHQNQTLVATLNNDCLQVVQALTGEPLTTFPWETNYATSSTTPIWSAGYVFVSTGYDRGCALLELIEGRLQAVYDNKNMKNHMNNCVLWEGHLYGIDGNSHNRRNVNLTCIDFRSGEVKWKHRGLGCGSLLLAGGHLLVLSDEGQLVVAPVSTEKFEPLSQASILSGRCWTVPVLSHGLIYARNAVGDLVCLDVR